MQVFQIQLLISNLFDLSQCKWRKSAWLDQCDWKESSIIIGIFISTSSVTDSKLFIDIIIVNF